MIQNLTTYSSNSKLQVMKVPKHSAGAFGQEIRFCKVDEFFLALDQKLLGNAQI